MKASLDRWPVSSPPRSEVAQALVVPGSTYTVAELYDEHFDFVFHIGLHRRLASAPHSPVKSAFYVTSPKTAHYAKVHAMLTDYSMLDVALFTDREAAAKWLCVPVEVLMAQR